MKLESGNNLDFEGRIYHLWNTLVFFFTPTIDTDLGLTSERRVRPKSKHISVHLLQTT